MKQKKHTTLSINGMEMRANPVPDRHHNEAVGGRYWLNQPGYYLIRLRLRHSQKAMRPLARIP